jgi:penicillin amidase
MLGKWNHVVDAHRAEPLIFEAWLTHLQRRLLKPRLGPQADSFGSLKPSFLKAVLHGRTVWCAAPGEPVPNSCDKAVADALDSALDDLARHFGDNMADWRWGDAHEAMFDALLYRYIPVLDNMTRLAVGTGGDDFTIQRGGFSDPDPSVFRHRHGAGLRAVYDLSDLDGSRFIIATGQSGSPVSAHWGDMLELWRDGATIALPPRHHPANVLELEPMDR